MPRPNEHVLTFNVSTKTLNEPTVKREPGGSANGTVVPKTIDVIQFTGSNGEKVAKSLRFKRSQWAAADAAKWADDHGFTGRFEQASGEGGTKGKAECPDCGEVVLMGKDETAAEHLCPTCEAQMKARTIETTTLKGMNIFRAGFWKGRKYGIDFLDKVIENFKAGYMEPYLKITADGSHAPNPPIFRNLSYGWVDNLWRTGDNLYADFKDVPTEVESAIRGGTLKKRSIEIPLDFVTGDGIHRGPVLKSTLFFGQGQPVVHGLEDLTPAFNEGDEPEGEILPAADTEKPTEPPTDRVPDETPTDDPPEPVKDNEPGEPGEPEGDKDKENTMPDMKISEQEYEDLKRSKIDGKLATERLTTIEVQMKENSDAKLEAEERASKAEEKAKVFEAKAQEARDASIDAFVSDRVNAGQIKPASKDAEIAHMKVMDEAVETDYRADMEKLEAKYPAKAGLDNIEPKTKSFKNAGEVRDAQIDAYLETNPEFVAKHGGRLNAYQVADATLPMPEPTKADGAKE